MTRRKTKITAGALVIIMLLTSAFTLGAFASGEIPASTYYEIDAAAHTVKGLLHNTFVGDFMARINSGSSVKKLVDAAGSEVFNGFVDDTMTLYIGNTQYSLEYFMLYDLGAKMEDYIAQNSGLTQEVLLDHTIASRNGYRDAVESSKLKQLGIVSGLAVGTKDSWVAGNIVKATVVADESSPYLELYSTGLRQKHLITEDFSGQYIDDARYTDKYIVTEAEIKSINYEGEPAENSTGFLSINHYYKADGESKNPGAVFTGNTDSVNFSDRGYFTVGGNETNTSASSSQVYLSEDKYNTSTEYNVKLYNINYADKTSSAALENMASGVYLNNTKQNITKTFDTQLASGTTSVDGISQATIGIGGNRISSTVGTATTVQISGFKVYLAENMHGEKDYVSVSSDCTIPTADENGYEITTKPATIKNVVPGTTASELIEKLKLPENAYAVAYDKSNSASRVRLADNAVLSNDNYINVISKTNGASGVLSRGYTITLSTYGAALSGNTVTVTGNAKGVRFIAAAYDKEGKLTEVKIIPSGESSASFTNAPVAANVFVLKDLVTLTPVTEVLPASPSAE